MRKIIVPAFVSLDGVMQAPGGPEEDTSGGFSHGGWLVPHFDQDVGAVIGEAFERDFDLLLGRKTYDIFAAHWPEVAKNRDVAPDDFALAQKFDRATKYVATHRPHGLAWQNTQALGGDVVGSLREIKAQRGADLVVQGSTDLLQTLLAADLVDELRLMIFPVVLGQGKRLFGTGTLPRQLQLTRSSSSSSGVLIAIYARGGELPTGSFALEQPSEAELTRRSELKNER